LFIDRSDAGRQLGGKLMSYRDANPVVLALPRGGVPVAYEVARALGAPLDLLFVRKIGVPWQPELAAAAVADVGGPEVVRNERVISLADVPDEYIEAQAQHQMQEIARRRLAYCEGTPRLDLTGRTVIVVDDGIATGSTVRAALRALRKAHPAKIVLAVPVAPPETLAELEHEADAICCLEAPEDFVGISQFYFRFEQLADEEIIDLLRRASGARQTGAERK
jgi:putative phosphoribosyl transferase